MNSNLNIRRNPIMLALGSLAGVRRLGSDLPAQRSVCVEEPEPGSA